MKKLIFILGILFLFCGCENNNDTTNNVDNKYIKLGDYGDYVKYIDDNISSDNLENDYNNLLTIITEDKNEYFVSNYTKGLLNFFNLDEHIKISIDISNEELNKLNNDYVNNNKESYRICNLNIEMNGLLFHYEEVGIRQKGNTSRGEVINEDGTLNLRHYKLNFTATFDDEYREDKKIWDDDKALKYREDRNFFGIEKINIRWNRNQDKTYLKEYYAYEIYRNNNVLAPHSNLVNVEMKINNKTENLGVYLAVEDIDKSFIKRNIEKQYTKGDLYKLGWSNVGATLDNLDDSLFGKEKQIKENDSFKQINYVYDLKTNKKTSNHEQIKMFISKVISTDTSNYFDFLNTDTYYDSVINYLAISYLLSDPDDLRGNANNTYVYFLSDIDKLIFIPTDNDRAFGSTGGSNPTGNYGVLTTPFDNNAGYMQNKSLFFIKSIFVNGNNKIKEDYLNSINNIINNKWLNIETFNAYYSKALNNYKNNIILGSNVNFNQVPFSLEEEKNINGNDNLSIEIYFKYKKDTFNKFNNEESIDDNSIYYFRGTNNNWNGIENDYCLKIINNVPTIIIYLEKNQQFKIASSDWAFELNYKHLEKKDLFSQSDNDNILINESALYKIEIINYKLDNQKLRINKEN